jgi:hypothetical protein
MSLRMENPMIYQSRSQHCCCVETNGHQPTAVTAYAQYHNAREAQCHTPATLISIAGRRLYGARE